MADKYDAFLDGNTSAPIKDIDAFLDEGKAPSATPTTVSAAVAREVPPMTTGENIALAADRILKELGSVAPDMLPSRDALISAMSSAAGTYRGIFGEKAFPKQGESLVGALFDVPAMVIGGGALKGAQMLPNIAKVSPTAMTWLKNVLGGAGGGATIGTLSENGDAASGAAAGAGIAGALPVVGYAAGKLSSAARAVIDSVSASGRARVGHKLVLDQLPVEERQAVLNILNQRGVDISPLGSPLTVGQSLAQARTTTGAPTGARLAALEDELTRMRGGESIRDVKAGQEVAQRGTLESLTGARGQVAQPLEMRSAADVGRSQMELARAAVAKSSYPTGVVSGDERLNEILALPAVRKALGVEENIAGNIPRPTQIGRDIPARTDWTPAYTEWQQTPFSQDVAKQFAQYPVKALQEQYQQIDKAATAMQRAVARGDASIDVAALNSLRAAKSALGDWLREASPAWARANQLFALQSRPISRADIGRELEAKWQQSPQAFLKATADEPAQEKLIASAIGRSGRSLATELNLGERSRVAGLRGEAEIDLSYDALRRLAKPDLSDEKFFQIPNVLNMYATIANRILRERGQATIDQVTKAAAEALADPAKLRQLLQEDIQRRAAQAPSGMLGKVIGPAIAAQQRGMLEEQ